MASITTLEEEEEEENETEDETDKMTADASRAKVMPMPQSDLADAELPERCWGPSQMILYKSQESQTESNSNSTQSDLEEVIHSNGTEELEGHCHGDAPDDDAAQQPMGNAVDFLWDCTGLQRAHWELAAKTRLGDLDGVLWDCVAAMLRLLNLFLDESLGYTWKKASEVVMGTE
jgi:hypothetical protein